MDKLIEERITVLNQQANTITTNLTKIDEVVDKLKSVLGKHFDEIIAAVYARKEALQSQLDALVDSLKLQLVDKKKDVSKQIELCTQSRALAAESSNKTKFAEQLLKLALDELKGVSDIEIPAYKLIFKNQWIDGISTHDLAASEVSLKQSELTTFAGSGVAGFEDGDGDVAKFNCPYDLAYNPVDGCCYVADHYNHKIRKINSKGVVSSLAGSGVGYADGVGTSAKFYYPAGIAIDHQTGYLYVTDYNNHRIRKITLQGEVSTFAGNGQRGSEDGRDANVKFNFPLGIAVDQRGKSVYVTDHSAHKIRKITVDGNVSTVAGTGVAGWLDGDVKVAQFKSPRGICINEATGVIYVADTDNFKIRKIAGGIVSTVAGTGEKSSKDGPVDTATFNHPSDVKIDTRDGSLIVCEYESGLIRRIHQGNVSTVTPAEINGVIPKFSSPYRISIDQAKHVCYIAEYGGHKISQLTL